MAESLIISVSGVRGIVGKTLTAPLATAYGSAFGSFLKEGGSSNYLGHKHPLKVCIGRDSRPSGPMIQAAVTAGLCRIGADVVDLGIVTTPTVGIMLRELGCDGGVVITASHNPLPYNGIKLLLNNGIAPPPAMAEKIKRRFLEQRLDPVGSVDCGKVTINDHADQVHLDKVLSIVDTNAIARKRFRVVLDSVNGAGGSIGRQLLDRLGCDVVAVNAEPTGLFAHEPEPTEANLQSLCDIMRQDDAVVGFAQDPDADRLAVVDENGVYMGEEYTLALAAQQVLSQSPGAVAANLSTSRMIDDIARTVDSRVIRTPVGEAHVAGAMIENNCVIGGEGNGGVIDLRVGPIRDSLVAMSLILQLMADTGQSISRLAKGFGGYVMFKDKFAIAPKQAHTLIEQTRSQWPGAHINNSDGCRFDFEDAWLHLRLSNTEPIMRLIIEAKDEATVRHYAQTVFAIRDRMRS